MSTIKCPNCKAELEENSSICQWCGFVINKQGKDSIEHITNNLSRLIVNGRKIPQQGLFSSLTNNAKISMPIFALISFILAYKVNAFFFISGLVFCIYAFISLFKKSKSFTQDLLDLQAEFDTDIRRIQTLYGSNNSISKQIQEFKNEWKKINQSTNRSKNIEKLSYALILILFLFALSLPTPKTIAETNEEQIQKEEKLVKEAENAIQNRKLNNAIELLTQIKTPENITRVKSMIQFNECKDSLNKAEQFIKNHDYELAKVVLENIKWKKISSDYDAELIEESFYKQFIQQKNSLIKKIPDNLHVDLEDEYNF